MLLTACILIAVSIYLILDTYFIKKFFGIVLLGSAINLIIFLAGKPLGSQPVFLSTHANTLLFGNPLAQALILTAIVIGFSLLAFLTTLLKMVTKKHQGKVK